MSCRLQTHDQTATSRRRLPEDSQETARNLNSTYGLISVLRASERCAIETLETKTFVSNRSGPDRLECATVCANERFPQCLFARSFLVTLSRPWRFCAALLPPSLPTLSLPPSPSPSFLMSPSFSQSRSVSFPLLLSLFAPSSLSLFAASSLSLLFSPSSSLSATLPASFLSLFSVVSLYRFFSLTDDLSFSLVPLAWSSWFLVGCYSALLLC